VGAGAEVADVGAGAGCEGGTTPAPAPKLNAPRGFAPELNALCGLVRPASAATLGGTGGVLGVGAGGTLAEGGGPVFIIKAFCGLLYRLSRAAGPGGRAASALAGGFDWVSTAVDGGAGAGMAAGPGSESTSCAPVTPGSAEGGTASAFFAAFSASCCEARSRPSSSL
jgi:hypothetical protein